jgi:hypothetical protein
MVDIMSILQQSGLNFNFGFASGAVNKTANIIFYMILFALIVFFIYRWYDRRKYNIVIRGHDLRGEHDFEFDDKGREYISHNRAELKLLKRKNANIIIPDLAYYRSMVNGARVIHVFKFGSVNDYVVLNPEILTELEEVQILDKDGQIMLNEDGTPQTLKRPRYVLKVTNSLSKEHSIRDLRDALTRFKKEDSVQKWTPIIMMIIIAVTILISAWVIGHYQLKSANINLDATKIATDTLNKWLDYQQTLGIVK